MKSTNHRKYHKQTIKQDAYIPTAIERIKFLVGEYPERKNEIIEKMPKNYSMIQPQLIENLIESVLVPMYLKKGELLKDGLERFDIELNVLKNGRLIPFEICRPERFIIKNKKKEEEAR